MSKKIYYVLFALLGLLLFGLTTQVHAQPPLPVAEGPQLRGAPGAAEPQVLEAGPLHEAFAKPLALDEQPNIIDRQPPAPINELPPDERPAGKNVQWLPGYWALDVERDDFVWISGLWRDVPPGRNWVPGEWQQVEKGFQWIPGFWAEAAAPQQRLLPVPADNLDQGPQSPPPGDNFLWNPGCWQWAGGDFAWQPGFWYAAQPDWVWVPNHYCYTPRGTIYVSGYWDYPLTNRGLCYAPVYYGAGYRFAAGYTYRPRSFVNTGLLLANLFLDSRHGCYYFGHHDFHDRFHHGVNRGGQGRGGHVHGDHGHGPGEPRKLARWNEAELGQWGRHKGKSKLYDPLWAHQQLKNKQNGTHRKHTAARATTKPSAKSGQAVRLDRDQLVRKVAELTPAERKTIHLRTNDASDMAKFLKQAEKLRAVDRSAATRNTNAKKSIIKAPTTRETQDRARSTVRVPQIDRRQTEKYTTGAQRTTPQYTAPPRTDWQRGGSQRAVSTDRLQQLRDAAAAQVLRERSQTQSRYAPTARQPWPNQQRVLPRQMREYGTQRTTKPVVVMPRTGNSRTGSSRTGNSSNSSWNGSRSLPTTRSNNQSRRVQQAVPQQQQSRRSTSSGTSEQFRPARRGSFKQRTDN